MTTTSSRERLIDSATGLFYEHGFHAVGLDQVLEEVGVTKTTFYNHFESKDDLIVAVLAHKDAQEMEQWTKIMRERGGSDPRRQIMSLFDILEEWFNEPGFRGCMFINAAVEFPSPNDPIHTTAASHGESMFKVIRDRAKEAGAAQPEVLARQMTMLISGALVSRSVDLDRTAVQTARGLAEMVMERQLGAVGA